MHPGVIDGRIETPADGVDPPIYGDHRQMITRLRQWCTVAPFVRRGIIDLVC